MSKKVIVFGGDGFCGWPTALHLSNIGYDVVIADNLSRRAIDEELNCQSLTPISSIEDRLAVWKRLTGNTIRFYRINVAKDHQRLLDMLAEEQPDAVVHFAEQRSAPYSMKSAMHRIYTIDNNLNATNAILSGIVTCGLNTHVVHLGTMGVYGYSTHGMKIPEGYLDVLVPDGDGHMESTILYLPKPGSIYHLTKTQDALLFQFFNKNDGLRITDLHQGVVWGTNTEETMRDEALINRFDYCGDYGTVLNRFLMQAAVNFPLTVYGTGGQTRAFIHIRDTVKCIELALENPPAAGERVKIFNQVTETHRVRDLARMVADITGQQVQFIDNPRKEAEENELLVDNSSFLRLGLQPTTLSEGLLQEITDIAGQYAKRCDRSLIMPSSYWNNEIRDSVQQDILNGAGRKAVNEC